MRIVRVLVAVAAAVFGCSISSAALADWSGWYSIGFQIKGEPSIVYYGGGLSAVGVVARGTDDLLYYTQSANGIDFKPWKPLKGLKVTSAPSCVSRQSGILDCYVRSTTNSFVEILYTKSAGWSGWVEHGGTFSAAPAAAGKIDRSTVLFGYAVGENTGIYSKQWSSKFGWGEWYRYFDAPSEPSFECDQSTSGVGYQYENSYFKEYRILCLIRDGNNKISGIEWVERGEGVQELWAGSLPDIPDSQYRPDVILSHWKKGHIFVVGLDGATHTATWTSGVGFADWKNLDGILTSGPSCTLARKSDKIDYTLICAGRGGNGEVYLNRLLK